MESEDNGMGCPEKEDYESSTHSTPQDHRSFAEFAKDKLDSAGRELRRRLPMAGQLGARLMHPRRLLLHSTPTQHTDVVLIFPKGLPDSMLLWLLQKLRGSSPRLRVCVRQHASSQCSAFYITADDDVLLQTAEEMHLPKLLKPEFGGGYKEFTVRDIHCFQKSTSASELLNSQERGALVKQVLESARAEHGDEHSLEPALTLRPGQSIVPACVSRGVVAAMFPLHERNSLESLGRKWVKTFFSPQPLDDISEYFGVKIAMYFAWLGHYTQSLTVPAVVGFVFWIWLGTANENWKDIAYVLFSMFNVLWACVYLETWKRYSNALAYKWGTLDQRDELLVEPRPLFQGDMSTSAVTGRPEPVYAAWRRRLWRHCVSFPLIVLCLGVAGIATCLFLRAQDWWDNNIIYMTWIPRVFLAIIIAVEEEIYARVARWLNDKDSEDREEEADNESQEWLHKKTKEQIHDRSSATPVLSTSLISTPSTTLVTSTCPLSFTPSSIPLVTSSNPITCTYTPSSETVTYTPSPVTRTITISSAPPTTNQRAKKRTNEDEENLSIEQIKRQIYLEELRNAREKHEMEKEFMLQKQKIELEILNIKKEILLKELNK